MESDNIRHSVLTAVNLLREILDESRKQTAILEKIAADTERTKYNTNKTIGSMF